MTISFFTLFGKINGKTVRDRDTKIEDENSKSRALLYVLFHETCPDEWETLNSQWNCNGRKQSPINIDTEAVIERNPTPPNIQITIEPEGSPVTGELVNNGYAPTFIAGSSTTIRLSGGNLLDDYFLKHFHFHYGCNDSVGSEHLIDGNSYPVEVGCVS